MRKKGPPASDGATTRRQPLAAPASAFTPTSSIPAPRHDLVGVTIEGKYRLGEVIGTGGMGTVFGGLNLAVGRPVAVKVLHPNQMRRSDSVKRFQQEARAAGGIGHPNLCEVYDLGMLPDGCPYLVMEKLVGETLADRILSSGPLPVLEALDVLTQVLSGLIAAHAHGIVHRDIKPENIFLTVRVGCPSLVKVLDFGVSKAMVPPTPDEGEGLVLTGPGIVMGTPFYMSPEQARGERDLDARVDLYACGVVLYEALTGCRPFTAPNYNALLVAILTGTPTPLRVLRPALPPELDAVVGRALARDRADRYQDGAEMQRDLQKLAALLTRSSMPPPPGTEHDRQFRNLAGAFGRFSADFTEAQEDGIITSEERATLEEDLQYLQAKATAMATELRGARPEVPAPPRPPGVRRKIEEGFGETPTSPSFVREPEQAPPPGTSRSNEGSRKRGPASEDP